MTSTRYGVLVGLGRALRIVREAEKLNASPQLASPWSTGDLSAIVWADTFGDLTELPVTRAAAVAIPALSKARDLVCTTIARLPLEAYAGAGKLAEQPSWLYRTNGDVSPYHRMLWTVDDLMFNGWSLWAVARSTTGDVLDAARVPSNLWQFEPDGSITINAQPVPADEVILIPGPHEGIVNRNATSIRSAAALERAYLSSTRNPTPDVELHQTDGVALTKDEAAELVAEWRAARQADGGAVAFTPASIELREHGKAPEALLIDGRNSAAVDMARVASVPASLVDATNAGASLTYETTAGRNLEFVDYALETYLGSIEARLSLDDVIPRGKRVAFDRSILTALVSGPSGPVRED